MLKLASLRLNQPLGKIIGRSNIQDRLCRICYDVNMEIVKVHLQRIKRPAHLQILQSRRDFGKPLYLLQLPLDDTLPLPIFYHISSYTYDTAPAAHCAGRSYGPGSRHSPHYW